MNSYLGGYYLVKTRPLTFGAKENDTVYTASECINNSLVSAWSYPWIQGSDKETEAAVEAFGLDDHQIVEIRKWIDHKSEKKKLEWINVFSEAETAREYHRAFFAKKDDINLFALYFDEAEAKDIIEELKPEWENYGEPGLYVVLSKQVADIDKKDETLIGYDLIGIEDGGGFHTFHCHDLGAELSEKFGLTLNAYGLFDAHDNWKPILDYLNDDENGCEPVPWFVAKMKLVERN